MSEMEPLDEIGEEISIEVSEADAVEHAQFVKVPADPRWPQRLPFEADPADVAEQERAVDFGEDDEYR